MTVVDKVHNGYVSKRRVRVLSNKFAHLIPQNSKVLDVGCGDGEMDSLVLKQRKDLTIVGIDVLMRPQTLIKVEKFDGETIPFEDKEFDVVTFVDVLHHTNDPYILLREAQRVSKKYIILKDHTKNGLLANNTLRFMDRVGNAKHGVVLPYNYWKHNQWLEAFQTLKMKIEVWDGKLGLYPFPANLVFERSLHFIAKIAVS
jgi:SAM-dependent methyltransferase